MKRLLKSLFVLSLVFSCLTIPVHAIDEGETPSGDPVTEEPAEGTKTPTYDVSGSKTASPVELDSNHRQTTVTLTLPSAEYKNQIDIVFVMDNSTSVLDKGFDFGEAVKTLLDNIVEENPGIDLKIGVVKFRGYATDMLKNGLLDYASNKNFIMAAIKTTAVPGSGSNVHSGLVMAEEFLAADTDVSDDHKYVILLTDGKSYIWNNEDNEPVMYYGQYYQNAAIKNVIPYYTQLIGIYNKENGSASYHGVPYETTNAFPLFADYNSGNMANNRDSSTYYANLFASEHAELTSPTKYEFPAYYTQFYKEDGALEPISPVAQGTPESITPDNSSEVFGSTPGNLYKQYHKYTPEEGSIWEGLNYFSVNPYNLKEEDGKVLFDVESPDEDFFLLHATGMEKGVYVAGHYWKDVIDAKYNTAAILMDPLKYTWNEKEEKWNPFTQGMFLSGSFDHWLKENSDAGAFITDNDDVLELFEGIDNDIRYMVNSGVVTDIIPDEFTLVVPESGSPFTVKVDAVNATKLKVEKDPEKENTWNFGDAFLPEGGKEEIYPYVVSYDGQEIIWEINVPVKNSEPVSLSFDLEIAKDAEPGYHDTNVSAILEFEPTTELPDIEKTYEFEVPRIIFNPLIDLTVTKVWEDKEFAELPGYERPDSVEITLLADDNEVPVTGVELAEGEWPYEYENDTEDVVLNEDNEWTVTFTNLSRYSIVQSEDSDELEITEIEYTVDELDIAGFTSEVGEFEMEDEIAEDADRLVGYAEIVNTPNAGEDLYTPITVRFIKYGQPFGSETSEPLVGAEFTLSGEGIEDKKYVSGEDGTFVIEFTAPGTYTLKETKAPKGYKFDDGTNEFTIVVEQAEEPTSVTLNEETGAWDYTYELLLDDATIELIDPEEEAIVVNNDPVRGEDLYTPITVKFIKYGASFFENGDAPLAGAEFTLSGDGIEDKKYVSGEDGTFEIEFTAPGTYVLTETKAPNGFELYEGENVYTFVVEQSEEPVKITLNEETGAWDFTYELSLDEVSEAQIDPETGEVIIYNAPEFAEYVFLKVWKDDDPSKRPDSITFTLFANGVNWGEVELTAEDEWKFIAYLPIYDGDGSEIVYEVVENTPKGYRSEVKFDGETYTFEIVNTPIPHTAGFDDFRMWGLLIAAAIMAFSAIMLVDIKKKEIIFR